MKPDLTLANRIAVCICEAGAVGFAIAVFVGYWVATP